MSHLIALLAALLVAFVVGCSQQAVRSDLSTPATTLPEELSVELTAADLYGGLEARRVLLAGDQLVLDTRNWSLTKRLGKRLTDQADELPGRVVTDVIDLGGGGLLSAPARIRDLRVQTSARTPGGTRAVTSIRHGPTFFQAKGWSQWEPIDPAKPVNVGPSRYVQVQIELFSDSAESVPAVSGVTMSFRRQAAMTFSPPVVLVESKAPQIVRSTIPFGYERMDQEDVAWLRKAMGLDKVIAGRASEMDKLIALNEWCAMRKNVRGAEGAKHMGGDEPYPWHIRKTFGAEDGGTVYGHCGSYSQVLITALTSLGWHARHIANEGYRTNSHEVVEVWVNELGKWVYFDPSLGTYYTDRKGSPLSMLEMHDLFVNFFVEPGKTLKDYLPRNETRELDTGWQRRRQLDFSTFPAVCKTNDYTYGEKKPWDWTAGQGIMTAGFLQMTPRNDFHSQPTPPHLRYCYGPEGVNGFPYWTDAKTPLWHDEADGQPHPAGLTRNWFTRHRDWNWTLNQASVRLIRTGVDQIAVELANSQPFFKHYRVTADGQTQELADGPWTWKLKPGQNTLTVDCVDEFGQAGIPARVTVEMKN